MPPKEDTILKSPPGYRSPEVASFMAQLDELSSRLRQDTRGMSRAELEWQPSPGMIRAPATMPRLGLSVRGL